MSAGRYHVTVGCALILALGAAVAAIDQHNSLPRLISGRIPFVANHQFGHARVKLTAEPDGRAVVGAVDSQPASLWPLVAQDLRRWRFDGPVSEMLVEVRFLERPNSRCSPDANRHVEIRWPTSIDVYVRRDDVICEVFGAVEEASRPPSIRGTVVSESGTPLRGVLFSLSGLDERIGVMRHVSTDEAGRFVVSGLPEGTYSAGFGMYGFLGREFRLVVSRDTKAEDWKLTLRRDPELAREPPVVVTAADVPSYPVSAYDAGISGTVELRVSFSQNPADAFAVIDIDAVGPDARLVQSAKHNVASWRYRNVTVPVLTVKYVFHLAPGDCSADQRPVASMHFPSSVEVVAKRRIPCSAVPSSQPR